MVGNNQEPEAGDVSRRAFLKRMAALAFAAPVVASFTIEGIVHASESPHTATFGNQAFPNQVMPNQFFAGHIPTGFFPNEVYANQYYPNQLP
jgi:hypothetical protein